MCIYPTIYLDFLIASIATQVKYWGEPGPTPTINKFFQGISSNNPYSLFLY